jgi:chromosome segregation ATPase
VKELIAEIKSLRAELKQVTAERDSARTARDELAEAMLQNQVAVISADNARNLALHRLKAANQRVEELYRVVEAGKAEGAHTEAEYKKLVDRVSESNQNTANVKKPLPSEMPPK